MTHKRLEETNGQLCRCRHAGVMLLAAGLALWPQSRPAALAQETPAAPAAQAQQLDLQAPLVDWSHVKRAHRVAESWARAGEISTVTGQDSIWVSGVSGVRITLRVDGVELGLGDALAPAGKRAAADQSQMVDLMPLVAEAMKSAFAASQRELQDRHRRAMEVVGKQEGVEALTLVDVGRRLLVDLQVGRELVQVTVAEDAPQQDVLAQFVPGVDGLRVSGRGPDGHTRAAMMWPATALASNISPESQLRQLSAAVAGDRGELGSIAKPGGLSLHKFGVIHVVRPSPLLPTFHLVRGNAPIPRTPLDQATLDSVSQRLVRYMLHQVRENGSLPGAYEPTSDRFAEELAEYKAHGLALYALARWSSLLSSTQGHEEQRREVNEAVQAMARSLTSQLADAGKMPDPPSMALLAMAIIESPVLAQHQLDRDNLVVSLLRLQNVDGSFRQTYDEESGLLHPQDQALVLAALAMHAERTRDPLVTTAVRLARKWQWSQVKVSHDEETWYWLMLAERLIDQKSLPVFMPAADEAARFQFMRRLAGTLVQRQITQVPADAPPDVLGGFVRMNQLWPDWQSAWATGYLAWAMADDVAEQDQQLRTLLASALGARYIARLMFDGPSCFYVARPDEVIGGVRASLIDNRLNIRYTAAGLLAMVELQQTLQQLDQQPLSAR